MSDFIDILSPKAYADLKLANAEIIEMVKHIKEVDKAFKGVKVPSQSVQVTKKASEALDKQAKSIEKARLAEIRLEQARERAMDKYEKQLQRNQQAQQRATEQAQRNAEREGQARLRLNIQNERANRAYNLLNENHKRASERVQDLIARGKTATQTQSQYNKELRSATADFQRLNQRVLEADQAVGRFNRNVGNYPQLFRTASASLGTFLSAFGVVGGIYMFASAIKSAFNSIKEFDKANTDLAATMGINKKDIKELTRDAVRLGGATKFTASEVSGLQKEFAKFGFSKREILDATEATLNLASATGEDLATSAMVAAQTLRGFGLDASEMGRVTDVMASSFTKSALDLSNFTESMKYVAPIAKTAGVSIEFATGMLAKLADAGIKGSMAGTSLRRILTEMAQTGLPASEAFDKIAKSGITVKDAMDDVGRTAQTALIVLSENKDSVLELSDAFEKAGGSAKRMADEQLESLEGKIILMTSAWDGFIQSLNSGDGKLSKFFIGAIEKATEFINVLQRVNETEYDEVERRTNSFINETRNNIKGLDADREKAWIQEKSRTEATLKQQKNELEKIKELEKAEKESFGYRVLKNQKEGYLLEQKRKEIEKEIKLTESVSIQINSILDDSYKNREDLIKDYTKRVLEVHKSANKEEVELYAKSQTNEILRKQLAELNKTTEAQKQLNQARKETRELLVGSVEWLENEISLLQNEQKQVSTNTEVYKEYQRQIDILSKSLEILKGKTEEVNGISLDFDVEDGWAENIDMTLTTALDRFLEISQEIQATMSSAFDFVDVLFQNQISRYDELINKSNEYYDALIANAEEGSAQEIALQEEKAEAEKRLEEQKRQAEIKAFRFRQLASVAEIAINTAIAISKVLAQTGVAAPALIPLIVAQGALQTATVLAQRPPAYAEGTDFHKGGDAIVGDGGKREVMITPDGKMRITPDQTTLIKNMPIGTKVLPDADVFLRNLMLNQAFGMHKEVDNTKHIEKAIERGFKKAKVNNYLSLPKIDLGHHYYKQKGL